MRDIRADGCREARGTIRTVRHPSLPFDTPTYRGWLSLAKRRRWKRGREPIGRWLAGVLFCYNPTPPMSALMRDLMYSLTVIALPSA